MYANPSTAIVCRPFLSTEECDTWLTRLDAQVWQDARVAVLGGADTVDEVRRCALTPLADPTMLARLTAALHELNAAVFAFDAWSFLDADPVVAMRYPVGGHFAWHIDNAAAESQSRKLSFTVQLTAPTSYDGGDLEFAVYHRDFGGRGDERAQLRTRGAITVFPAFQLHRVTPVRAANARPSSAGFTAHVFDEMR